MYTHIHEISLTPTSELLLLDTVLILSDIYLYMVCSCTRLSVHPELKIMIYLPREHFSMKNYELMMHVTFDWKRIHKLETATSMTLVEWTNIHAIDIMSIACVPNICKTT